MKNASLVLLSLLAACASAPPQKPPPPAVLPAPIAEAPVENEQPPLLQLPETVKPTHYTIAMEIDPDADGFVGREDIAVELATPRRSIWLHGRDLQVGKVWLEQNGAQIPGSYLQVTDQGVSRVTLERQAKAGPATLHFEWKGKWNEQLKGLYRASSNKIRYAFTQFEAIDARFAFPGFDEPRFKTPYDMSLLVPVDDVAVSNTPEVSSSPQGTHKLVRFATTHPLPTYLVAWAVGPFEVVAAPPLPPNEVRDHPLPMRAIAPKGQGAQMAFALEAGAGLLVTLEKYFGIPYPYPKLDHIAVPDFSAGAMENAGAITYRDSILAFDPKTEPETLKTRIAGVMAHEMAHQWFGDLVTLPWWTDAWLNEAFATWMGNRAVETWRPEYQAELHLLEEVHGAMSMDALVNARKIRQPLARTEDVWNQFDSLTYQKGAAVISMFERWVGHEKFRQGIHDYLSSHAWGTGSTDAFLDAIAKASGKEVQAAFKTFLEQPGVPLVEAKVQCENGSAQLSVTQSRYLPLGSTGNRNVLWQVPFCARYAVSGAEKETCTLLTTQVSAFALEGCPQWLMPNAGAAGYYRWSLSGPELTRLRTKGYPKLNVPERLSFADNLDTGLRSGSLQAADVLSQLGPIVKDSSPEVATSPMDTLGRTIELIVSDANRAKAQKFSASLYRPLAAKVGWKPGADEPIERHQLRQEVLNFVALVARDPQAGQKAAKLGMEALSAEDGLGPVHPDLQGLALTAAVQREGKVAYDKVLRRFEAASGGSMRGRYLRALGSSRNPELAARSLDLVLDPKLRKNERLQLLRAVASERETRQQTWDWLTSHYDALIKLIPEDHASALPFFGAEFCDAPHLDQLKAFFGPKAEKMPGMPRSLAQAQEAVSLCIAEKQAQAESANAFFAKQK